MERPRDIRHGNNQLGYTYGNKFNDSNFNKNIYSHENIMLC